MIRYKLFGKATLWTWTLSACGLSLIGCAAPGAKPGDGAPAADQKDVVSVRVLLYSGRPDPTFTLDEVAEFNRVKELLQDTTVDDQKTAGTVIPSILGYKGIIVTNSTHKHGLPTQIAVFKDRLEITLTRVKERRTDRGSSLEEYLLQLAQKKQVIDDKQLRLIRGE